jgi:cytochrome oxidase Cu insertion factor (SCO1/SenC/PrrC family)
MHGLWLGLTSLALAAANGAWFLARMRRVALQSRLAHELLWGASVALGLAAFASHPGWLGGAAAALGVLAGAAMLALRAVSAQAKNVPAVAVGGKVLDFTAPDENGAPFTLSSLAGKSFLLKFFRGHW